MGKIFGDLTNTQLATPGGPTISAPSPQQVGSAMSQTAQPSLQDPTSGNFAPPPQGPQPTVSKPSFLQAMDTGPGGTPNAMSKGLNTKGAILTTILAAAKGGLAGEAAGLQGNPRTGYGGTGAGIEAGLQLPFVQAQQRQALQAGQTQNQLQQAQIQNLPFVRAQQQAALAGTQAKTFKDTALGQKALRPTTSKEGSPDQQVMDQLTTDIDPKLGRPLTPEEALTRIATLKQDVKPDPKQQRDDKAIAIQSKDPKTWTPEEASYMKGYRAWVKETKTDPGVMRAEMFIGGKPLQVADDSGRVTYEPARQAMAEGAQAPGSAAPSAAKAMAKSATSGPIGNELQAYNTAIAHADLLDKAFEALNNGDQRTLNKMQNSFNTEFGGAGVPTYETIANAYSREVTKALSAGHLTDAEIHSQGATLPPNASPAQFHGVIGAYRGLMASKKAQTKQRVDKGLLGQPNYDTAPTSAPGTGGFFEKFDGKPR